MLKCAEEYSEYFLIVSWCSHHFHNYIDDQYFPFNLQDDAANASMRTRSENNNLRTLTRKSNRIQYCWNIIFMEVFLEVVHLSVSKMTDFKWDATLETNTTF